MVRFLFRFLAFIALAIAVMYAVIDAARSIGASAVVFTRLEETAMLAMPETIERFASQVDAGNILFVTPAILDGALALPVAGVALVLAFFLQLIGQKPKRRRGRFFVE